MPLREDVTDVVLAGADRRRRLMLALLVVLVVTLGLVHVRHVLWPVVAWPVYARSHPDGPGATSSIVEARVRTKAGGTYALRSEDLVEFSRREIAVKALEGSIDNAEDRAYLMRLVQHSRGDDVDFIELWAVTWKVDAQAVPPIQRPVAQRKLVGFRADDADASR